MSRELQDKAFEKIEWCIEQYRLKTGAEFKKFVSVSFKLKGHTAGWANGDEVAIRLNNDLLVKYGQEFINGTVVHEMAHIFAYDQNPHCAAHGMDWYEMMFMLGHPSPSRCHQMETKPARKTRQYKYKCECGRDHRVSTMKHNRISNGSIYRCVHCNREIWRDRA